MTLAELYEKVKQNATSAYGRPILDEGYSMYDLSKLEDNAAPDEVLRNAGYLSKHWMDGSWANTPGAADFGGDLNKMTNAISPGGQWIDDPNFGKVYKVADPNNPFPVDVFGDKHTGNEMANLVLAGILGVGGAGLAGMLPGTTSAFGGAAAGGATAGLPESYWSMLADAGGVASDAAAVGAGTVGGGVDYSLASGLAGKGIGGAPAGLGITPSSSFGAGLGAAAPASSLASNLGTGIGSGIGSGLVNLSMNPSGFTPSSGGAPVQEGPTTPSTGPLGSEPGLNSGDFTIKDLLPGGKYANLTGSALATALGLVGSSQQANAYKDISDKYFSMGAPYRGKLEASYAPGFSMADQPDFMNALDVGAKAAASATAAKYGNPVDNPGAYAEMQKYISGNLALPQLNTYRSQLGTFGQLGTNMAGTADLTAANAGGNTFNVLGAGVNDIFNPRKSTLEQLQELMKLRIG